MIQQEKSIPFSYLVIQFSHSAFIYFAQNIYFLYIYFVYKISVAFVENSEFDMYS